MDIQYPIGKILSISIRLLLQTIDKYNYRDVKSSGHVMAKWCCTYQPQPYETDLSNVLQAHREKQNPYLKPQPALSQWRTFLYSTYPVELILILSHV